MVFIKIVHTPACIRALDLCIFQLSVYLETVRACDSKLNTFLLTAWGGGMRKGRGTSSLRHHLTLAVPMSCTDCTDGSTEYTQSRKQASSYCKISKYNGQLEMHNCIIQVNITPANVISRLIRVECWSEFRNRLKKEQKD